MNRLIVVLGLGLLLAGGVQAKENLKTKEWLTGKLLASEEATVYLGERTTVTGDEISNTAHANTSARYSKLTDFHILYDGYVLVARQSHGRHFRFYVTIKRNDSAVLTVNDRVQFRFRKSREIEVLDEDGKKHKMRIVKKIRVPEGDG